MTAGRPKPYVSDAVRLEGALASLEGWAFGRWLQFAALGYGDQLYISLGGWTEVNGFRGLPGTREFVDKLNAAMTPVIDDYANKLRHELANECAKIAAKSLGAPA